MELLLKYLQGSPYTYTYLYHSGACGEEMVAVLTKSPGKSRKPKSGHTRAFKSPCGYYRMLPKFSPLSASSPSEMKQTQRIETPVPHGSHVDCSASLTKLTVLQAPIAILSVCVYGRPGFYCWEKRYRCRHRHRFYRSCTPALTESV
jgi:hypothetical protein